MLVLIAFCIDRGVRTPNNYFIISLAVTDLTIGLISINFLIVYLLLGYWPLGNFICDLWLTIDFTACLVSQVTVFLITLDRYFSVKFPVKYRNWRSEVKLKCILSISWVAPASLWTPLIFAWYEITGQPRPPPNECNVPFTNYTTFNTLIAISYFWIPLCFMTSIYVGIYKVAAGLHQKLEESHKGLADLILMAGTTMSKIGLSASVTEPTSKIKPVNGSEKPNQEENYVSTGRKDNKIADADRRLENGMNKQTQPNRSSVQFQTENPTECVDSGLGESNNNQRPQSDLEYSEHKGPTGSVTLESPEFCESYRCISSPNAPPSQTSSVSLENYDPWTHRNEIRTSYRFEDHCMASTKHSQGNETNSERKIQILTLPQQTHSSKTQEEKKSKFQRSMVSFCQPFKQLRHIMRSESCAMVKAEVSSSDSSRHHDSQNSKLPSGSSQQTSDRPSSMRDRFFRFENSKNIENRKTERRKRRRARKALRMISLIMGAFIICWTPYHIIIIVKGFCDIPSTGYSCIDVHLYNFAYFMCYMNSPLNPFCYAMANVAFKRAFLRILHGDFRIK
nr:Amine (Acetylcholine) G protein-coupled receptor [Hymenolepis microstoma]